jgi:protein-tyrosine phosphatase
LTTQLPAIDGPWPGKLVVLPRPRGGDWLEDEVAAWRAAGIGTVVSLLTKDEEADLDLGAEAGIVQRQGMQFLSFPIPDYSVPASRADAAEFLGRLANILTQGSNVIIHCRGGLGRAPLVAASLLATVGVPPDVAFQRISDVRRSVVPETGEQRRWVIDFAAQAAPVSPVPSR